ncbi:MAG: biotin/lipoyl-binding protein [Pseudomonadales bacterium]|nr:biotin/lipoyl-binding protein [Pseudomonadales bacterium]
MFAPILRFFQSRSVQGRRLWAGAAFLTAAALMSAYIFATGPQAIPEPRLEKAWPVATMRVTPGRICPTFRAYGRVEASRIAHLRTDLVAEVDEVHVREGDWVQAGDRLITLNDRELALRLIEARAELAEFQAARDSLQIEKASTEGNTGRYQSMLTVARNKLQRHKDLMSKRLISQSLLDEVVAQADEADIQYQAHMRALADFPNRSAALDAAVARAAAGVQQAQYDLEKSRVLAPFSGPVLGVFVAPGDRSNLGMILADVADARTFEVRVQLPDGYAQRLQRRMLDTESITATSQEGLNLQLSRLSSQVKRGQSGLDAFFGFESSTPTPANALGRLMELVITLPEEAAVVAVPVQSIYENDRIYQVHNNRLQAITVERVGESQTAEGEYRILVRSPELETDTAIITTQLPRAIDGLLVEPA